MLSSFNVNSFMDIINSIDIILINLQQMKQDSCINNKDRNIHQFLCDLSCDLQKINNLLKSYSPKNDNCEEKINNLENKIVCLEKELMNSNNKIQDLNYLNCDLECKIKELLNSKSNFCPYCNNNINNMSPIHNQKLNPLEMSNFDTKSTFYKNLENISYDNNNKSINLKNRNMRNSLSFDDEKSPLKSNNDILLKTSNIINFNYNKSPYKNYSLSPKSQEFDIYKKPLNQSNDSHYNNLDKALINNRYNNDLNNDENSINLKSPKNTIRFKDNVKRSSSVPHSLRKDKIRSSKKNLSNKKGNKLLKEPKPEIKKISPIKQNNEIMKNKLNKNYNPNVIKRNNYNKQNQIYNNLYIERNSIFEKLKNKNKYLNNKKLNKIENLIQKIYKDENTINILKERLGDDFIDKLINENENNEYINKIEEIIQEINNEKNKGNKINNIQKFNSSNFPKKSFSKLNKEILNNKYNYKEYPRGWNSTKDYFVNNNSQSVKIEKSKTKIPNFP